MLVKHVSYTLTSADSSSTFLDFNHSLTMLEFGGYFDFVLTNSFELCYIHLSGLYGLMCEPLTNHRTVATPLTVANT